jgi:TIR domain
VAKNDVFISYSHKDKKWRQELETHLKPYLRNGIITSWSDQQIEPGSQWFGEIQTALTSSRIAVLLVSPDFLASDFIHEHELGPLLKKAEEGGVKILWIAISSCAYKQTPLKSYEAIIDPDTPMAEMRKAKRDRAWVNICEKIQRALGTDEGRPARSSDQSNRLARADLAEGEPGTSPPTSPPPALEWEDHLGHTYEGIPPAIFTKAIQFSAKNVSNGPVQLEQAHFKSTITEETAEAKVATPDGFLDPSETTPIPPDGSVTLRAEFKPPAGLPAREFIDGWGKMVLYVTYDGITNQVQIGENTTRALFTNFRPNPIEPTVRRAITDSLMVLASTDGREAIKKCWPAVGRAILRAVKAEGGNPDPGSTEVKDALNTLTRSGRFPGKMVNSVHELWRKAHMVYYQSRFAYDPQKEEAQEFIREAERVELTLSLI